MPLCWGSPLCHPAEPHIPAQNADTAKQLTVTQQSQEEVARVKEQLAFQVEQVKREAELKVSPRASMEPTGGGWWQSQLWDPKLPANHVWGSLLLSLGWVMGCSWRTRACRWSSCGRSWRHGRMSWTRPSARSATLSRYLLQLGAQTH